MTQTITQTVNKIDTVTRGEVWYADLGETVGSEQGGIRPVLIIQNDIGNKYSTTVTVAPFTSQNKNKIPTHVDFTGESYLNKPSILMIEQMRTIDKCRLQYYAGKASDKIMADVDKAIAIQTNIRVNHFSIDEAFKLLKDIYSLKIAIQYNKQKVLVDMLNDKTQLYRDYCKEYKINCNQLIEDFKREKLTVQ